MAMELNLISTHMGYRKFISCFILIIALIASISYYNKRFWNSCALDVIEQYSTFKRHDLELVYFKDVPCIPGEGETYLVYKFTGDGVFSNETIAAESDLIYSSSSVGNNRFFKGLPQKISRKLINCSFVAMDEWWYFYIDRSESLIYVFNVKFD